MPWERLKSQESTARCAKWTGAEQLRAKCAAWAGFKALDAVPEIENMERPVSDLFALAPNCLGLPLDG